MFTYNNNYGLDPLLYKSINCYAIIKLQKHKEYW